MFGFEFYITNFETEYVICFNHHDCLLGCGTAKKWVESLHYFQSESGKVFDVKVKSGWSN